jgi:2-C-methyl-D-erythritol 4-phosphate cytidylyltransferase
MKSVDCKELQQMLTQSQLPQPAYRDLALISCMLGYNPRYHDGAYLNVNVTLWRCEFNLWLVLYSTVGTDLRM